MPYETIRTTLLGLYELDIDKSKLSSNLCGSVAAHGPVVNNQVVGTQDVVQDCGRAARPETSVSR